MNEMDRKRLIENTKKNLDDLGVPESLLIELCESPARREAVTLIRAILSAIKNREQEQVTTLLFSHLLPADAHQIAIKQGGVSLANRLDLVFSVVLDIFSHTESVTMTPPTQEQ